VLHFIWRATAEENLFGDDLPTQEKKVRKQAAASRASCNLKPHAPPHRQITGPSYAPAPISAAKAN
jgi:hypothetical protein